MSELRRSLWRVSVYTFPVEVTDLPSGFHCGTESVTLFREFCSEKNAEVFADSVEKYGIVGSRWGGRRFILPHEIIGIRVDEVTGE